MPLSSEACVDKLKLFSVPSAGITFLNDGLFAAYVKFFLLLSSEEPPLLELESSFLNLFDVGVLEKSSIIFFTLMQKI